MSCIPLLLAVRSAEIIIKDEQNDYRFDFNKMTYSISDYVEFMRKSGLFDLLQNHIINNLRDYVLGIEVGLDSNGRKKRGGDLMENLVERYIVKAGYKLGVDYFHQMSNFEIEKKWGLDLSPISAGNTTTKVFDFVIKTKNRVYVIETNFYATQGSKLSETARSYKMIAEESKMINGLSFVWITDGAGWRSSARKNLEETFNEMEYIYNIDDLDNGSLCKLI